MKKNTSVEFNNTNELERLISFIDKLAVWAVEKEEIVAPLIGQMAKAFGEVEQ